ncbi:hypothetical protein D9M70_325650 [compost metagenome]
MVTSAPSFTCRPKLLPWVVWTSLSFSSSLESAPSTRTAGDHGPMPAGGAVTVMRLLLTLPVAPPLMLTPIERLPSVLMVEFDTVALAPVPSTETPWPNWPWVERVLLAMSRLLLVIARAAAAGLATLPTPAMLTVLSFRLMALRSSARMPPTLLPLLVIVSALPSMLDSPSACSAAVVAVVVAPPVTWRSLSLRVILAPSSARAALALPPPTSREMPAPLIWLSLPVASRPWLRLKDFSPSTGVALETAAPLVLICVPSSRWIAAPLRAQAPTEPLPLVLIEPPCMSIRLALPSASRPWPLPPAVVTVVSVRSAWPPSMTFTPSAEAPLVVSEMLSACNWLSAPLTTTAWLPPVVLRAPVVLMLAPSLSVAEPPFSTARAAAPQESVLTEPPLKSSALPGPVIRMPRLLLPLAPPPTDTRVSVRLRLPPDSTLAPVMSLAVIATPAPVLGSRVTLLPVASIWPPSLACRPIWPLACVALSALLSTRLASRLMLPPAAAATPVVSVAPSLTVSLACTPEVPMPMPPAVETVVSAATPKLTMPASTRLMAWARWL